MTPDDADDLAEIDTTAEQFDAYMARSEPAKLIPRPESQA